MLLNGTDTPPGNVPQSPGDLLTEQNLKAAQSGLMGMVLMYTAGGKAMPEWLKVALLVAGVGAVAASVTKISKSPQ